MIVCCRQHALDLVIFSLLENNLQLKLCDLPAHRCSQWRGFIMQLDAREQMINQGCGDGFMGRCQIGLGNMTFREDIA